MIESYTIDDLLKSPFEKIKKISEHGYEFWSARDLSCLLEYSEYRKFKNAIEKAEIACKNSGEDVSNHFAHMGEMVELGSGAKREIDDVKLFRFKKTFQPFTLSPFQLKNNGSM